MDKKLFYLIIFISATGICTGTFYQIFISDTASQQLTSQMETIMDSASMSSVINKIFKAELSLLVILLSSVVPVFMPAIFIIPAVKGFSYGFSSALLLSMSGMKGILHILLTLLPFALIQTAVFAAAGCLSMSMRQSGQRKGARKIKSERAMHISIILSTVLLISCILETFLQVLIL